MLTFDKNSVKNLYKAPIDSTKTDNGQVTVIGGSKLFHGAPLFALTTASRIVDMVFFASPEPSIGEVANKIKSKLFSFIWIPWNDLDSYIEKSDAVLIGPGFMRFSSEKDANRTTPRPGDSGYEESREITRDLLNKFPDKKWVIDAGSLQVMESSWIPKNSILTPNQKEYKMLFDNLSPEAASKKHKCILVLKGPSTFVYTPNESYEVKGGNPGLTKGGTGDVEAGLTVALLAKNDPTLSACAASFITKKTAEKLSETMGIYFNSDDLANHISDTLNSFV